MSDGLGYEGESVCFFCKKKEKRRRRRRKKNTEKKRYINQSVVCLGEVKKLKMIYKTAQIFEHLRQGVQVL